MRADLDTLVIAVYCAACSLFPAPEPTRRRGRPQKITDNELICLMVAQMLLPGFRDQLSFIDTTPLPCGQSLQTVNRSELAPPWCGFGYSAAHCRFYWGMRLALWSGLDGCGRDFDLVPANAAERPAVLALLERQPISGQLVIADKGFAGADFEQAVAALGANLLRPSRSDQPDRPSPPIRPIRERIESIVQSLKYQLRLEQHLARTPTVLIARIAARILALNPTIHLNWQLGQPARALSTYGY